jgi:NADH dehydrogenase
MAVPPMNVVTGAFGYTGRYIARSLLAMGERVRTLTGHPNRPNPFHGQIEIAPFAFDDHAELVRALAGASTLYNTYWVRFEHGPVAFEKAVQNTLSLFRAAKEAGIRRVVHVSITNPRLDSPLSYFRGKAVLERALAESGLSYAIIRPSVIFGREDILINNIAWLLRKFPVFAVPGDGQYRLQPVYAEDVAEVAVKAGHESADITVDAVGPETYAYEALVRLIADAIGRRVRIVRVPPALALMLSAMLGLIVRDVVLTPQEIDGLMAGLLASGGPPTGRTRFSEWLKEEAATLGIRYASELARHYRP